MKIKSVLLPIIISMFVSDAFSKDYINEQYGISFWIPDDWKIKYYEDLPTEIQQQLTSKYKPSQTLAICGIRRPDKQNRTNIVIQYQNFKNIELRDAIRELKSEHGKKRMISMAELFAHDILGKELKSYRIVESDSGFDNDRNMAFGIVYYQKREKSYFVAMESKLLVEDGIVPLLGWANGTEVDNFEKTIYEIIDSFEFDQDAASKEVSSLSGEKKLNRILKWGGIILTVSIILGFVKMFLGR